MGRMTWFSVFSSWNATPVNQATYWLVLAQLTYRYVLFKLHGHLASHQKRTFGTLMWSNTWILWSSGSIVKIVLSLLGGTRRFESTPAKQTSWKTSCCEFPSTLPLKPATVALKNGTLGFPGWLFYMFSLGRFSSHTFFPRDPCVCFHLWSWVCGLR